MTWTNTFPALCGAVRLVHIPTLNIVRGNMRQLSAFLMMESKMTWKFGPRGMIPCGHGSHMASLYGYLEVLELRLCCSRAVCTAHVQGRGVARASG